MGPSEAYAALQGQVLALHLGWGTSLHEHSLGIGISPAGKDLGLLVDENKCQWGCKREMLALKVTRQEGNLAKKL